jgi:predicted ATPase/DNA-binding XRE family transcriptional regulator
MGYRSSFGAWVRHYRKALGLTQAGLAGLVACSTETIRKIELGKRRPSLQIAELLARSLEVPVAEQHAFLRAARSAEPAAEGAEELQRSSDTVDEASSLIGRGPLAAHILQALTDPRTRLLTLAGPAGVGKTSLALEAAARAGGPFAGAVETISLVAVGQPEQVLPAVAEALRLPQAGARTPLDQLAEHIGAKRMLLVLDNMEHVLAAAPALAALLAACPALTVLTTSRAPLRIGGERIVEVPPLEVPPPVAALDPERLLRSSAAELFVIRACEVRPAFTVTAANAEAIAGICRQMDGLPLAIELVAARSNVLSPQALLERLSGSHGYAPLELPKSALPAGSRGHHTLRDAIGWSFGLLSKPQRQLFMWLGVFSGGFTLAAAERVCAATGLRPIDVLDELQALIEAHLLLQLPGEGDELRFSMLVTIREYARERLDEAGEHGLASAAHLGFFIEYVDQLRSAFQKAGQEQAMLRLEREHDNLRAALAWALEHAIGEAAALGAKLWWFWYVRSHWRAGHDWLEQILQRYDQASVSLPDELRVKLLNGAGSLAQHLANYGQAAEWLSQSLAASRAAGHWPGVVATLINLGGLAHIKGEAERSRQHFAEALDLARSTGRMVGVGLALSCLGVHATEVGQFAAARAYLDESMAVMGGLDYQFGVTGVRLYMADLALAEGDYGQAAEHYAYVLDEQRTHNNLEDVAMALLGLGWVRYHRGDPREALRQQREALQICHEQGARYPLLLCLDGCAASLGALAAIEAAQLCGAAAAERERLELPRLRAQGQAYDRALAQAAALHAPERWQAACARGRATPLSQAVALALTAAN